MELTRAEWRTKAAAVAFRRDAFIDGHSTPAVSGERFATIDPATGATLAEVAASASRSAIGDRSL